MWAKLLYLVFQFSPLYTLQMSTRFFMVTQLAVFRPNALRIPSVSFVKEWPMILVLSKHSSITSAILTLFDLKPSKMYIFFPVEICMMAASSTFQNFVCPTIDSVSIPKISAFAISSSTSFRLFDYQSTKITSFSVIPNSARSRYLYLLGGPKMSLLNIEFGRIYSFCYNLRNYFDYSF